MSEDKWREEQDDVLAEFDRLSNDLKKTTVYSPSKDIEPEKLTPLQHRRQTRSERLEEKENGAIVNRFSSKAKSLLSKLPKRKEKINQQAESDMSKKKVKKPKRLRVHIKRLVLALFCLVIMLGLGTAYYIYSIIKDAVEIDPNTIYSHLSENSILYDDAGVEIDSIYSSSDGKRTNISFANMPEDLYNAFVAIEDKTFWTHKGFNVVRMVGAVRDSFTGGGKISGTSTISQQLARNIYLTDTRTEYTLRRKIIEAYYTLLIERHLTKQQIIEVYLNTINLGFNSHGVQAAAQAYFSKDVSELDLLECVALAAMPQSPTTYALIRAFPNESIADDNENILSRGNAYTYIYNGDVSSDRRQLILRFMLEQEYIEEIRYQAAIAADLRDHMNPYQNVASESSTYFVDYVQDKVIEDLMKVYGYDLETARRVLNNNGLRIYSTVNMETQRIIEAEFADNANFPKVTNLKKDSGNILSQNKNVLLYSYNNYFDEEGRFTLDPSEYEPLPDGRLKLLADKRLNFYKTEVQGNVDYSVEFKQMYTEIEGVFYRIEGGFISIPREYKDRDGDGNLIISADFFIDKPNFFTFTEDGISIASRSYSLKQYEVQPQAAMVITDYKTGHIKAMVGGRNTVGRLLFNRASSPRQPGSAIKPIGVYGPALQSAVDTALGGSTQVFEAVMDEEGEDEEAQPAGNLYGNFWTAASVIDDAPMTVGGKTWPKNWYTGYRGLTTMRVALEQSINVCAVKVFMEIGPEYSYQFLKKLGVTSIVDSGPTNDMNAAALSLGGMTRGISPLEMAGAYGAFANEGVYVEPIAYTKVTNKHGDILLDNTPVTAQVMDPGVAFIMTDMMRSTVTSGIAGSAAIGTQPVAGKTGTTTDNFDAWFVGFTPQYSASLWIGNDVGIELSQGSIAATRLWSKIMKQVSADIPTGQFPAAPANVTSAVIDTKSGLLPSDLTALDPRGGTTRSEYFIKGTVPTGIDNVHTYVIICTDSNYLATPFCYYTVSAFGTKRPYPADPAVGDIIYEVPHYYCFLHNPDVEIFPVKEDAWTNYEWEGRYITLEPPEPEVPDDIYEFPWYFPDHDDDRDYPPPDMNYDDMPEDLRPI